MFRTCPRIELKCCYISINMYSINANSFKMVSFHPRCNTEPAANFNWIISLRCRWLKSRRDALRRSRYIWYECVNKLISIIDLNKNECRCAITLWICLLHSMFAVSHAWRMYANFIQATYQCSWFKLDSQRIVYLLIDAQATNCVNCMRFFFLLTKSNVTHAHNGEQRNFIKGCTYTYA